MTEQVEISNKQSSTSNDLKIKTKPVIGISECLMGEPVRFNGGHKRSRFCTDVLSEYFEFKPLCPEVAIGMTIPRKPIRLAEIKGDIRVIATDNPALDYTDPLKSLAKDVAPQMSEFSGYIFMQNSPSCGVYSSKVYSEKGHPIATGPGAFAGELMNLLPLVPVTEDGRLNDNQIRENFISTVYAYHEWQTTVEKAPTAASLINFHHRYKYHLLAHCEVSGNELGKLLSDVSNKNIHDIASQYISLFMKTMRLPVSRKGQTNVLVRLHHFLKRKMNDGEKRELTSLIGHYRNGVVPLIVPMTLVKYFTSKYESALSSAILDPYPMELGLKNGI